MLAAGIFAASAADATIDFSAQGYVNNYDLTAQANEIEGFTFTFDKGENTKNGPKYYTSGTAVRMYAGNTMTIAAPAGATVTKIEMTLASGSYTYADDDSAYTASAGTFTADPKTAKTATWTGSTTDALTIGLLNAKNAAGDYPQFRIKSMVITYNAGVETKCATPRFSIKGGTFYEAKEVSLTCSTEGASISYTINGGEAKTYSEAIQLSEVGTYEITAVANKDGLDSSDTATETFVIAAPVEVSSIAEFIMSGEGDSTPLYKWNFPVTVAFQSKGDDYGSTFVKDANGDFMYIYGKDVPAYNTGDVIPAGIQGEYTNYKGLYEMQYPVAESFAASTENVGYTPIRMGAGEITTNDLNKIIIIPEATYTEGDSGKTMSDATGSVTVYYNSKWGVESATSGTAYDLLCAVAIYNTGLQVTPIKFMASGSRVNTLAADATVRALEGAIEVNANGNVLVVNAAGQVVASQAVNGQATISLAKGFYIVRAAGKVVKVVVK